MRVAARSLAAGLVLGSCVAAGGLDASQPQVAQAADEGLRHYLAQIGESDLQALGFSGPVAAGKVSLGSPLAAHRLAPGALATGGRTADSFPDLILAPAARYYVPVLVEGRSRAVLIVERVQDRWEAVSFGHPRLGRALDRLLSAWPMARGFHPQLVVVPRARAVLFSIPEVSRTNLTFLALDGAQLTDAVRENASAEAGTLTGLAEALSALRRRMDAGRGGGAPAPRGSPEVSE